MHHIRRVHSDGVSHSQRHLGDAPRMAFRFLITQIEHTRPPLDGGVVGQGQVEVGTLHVVKQYCILDRDRRLPGQGFQKVQPLRMDSERLAMKAF